MIPVWERFVPKILVCVKVLCNNKFMKDGLSPETWILNEFNQRKARSPRYSLRAFAEHLGLPPGRVSEFFAGKRRITESVAQKIASRLGLKERETKVFLGSFSKTCAVSNFNKLSSDRFFVISDWYHFAILNLMQLDEFKSDAQWMAKRLGINKSQVVSALDRLERLELVEKKKNQWIRCETHLSTTTDVDSEALRKSHKQSLEQAIQSLDKVDVKDRDITSITMSIDPKKLPQAKQLIKQFRRQLSEFLEEDKKKEVYNLNVQLVPVTKLESELKRKKK